VLALDGELLDLRVRLSQHLHEVVVRTTPHGQVDLARSEHRLRATTCGSGGHRERNEGEDGVVCSGVGGRACGLGRRGRGESSGYGLALSLDFAEADAVASAGAEEAMVCVTRGWVHARA
jgi:hypothetical protein